MYPVFKRTKFFPQVAIVLLRGQCCKVLFTDQWQFWCVDAQQVQN